MVYTTTNDIGDYSVSVDESLSYDKAVSIYNDMISMVVQRTNSEEVVKDETVV